MGSSDADRALLFRLYRAAVDAVQPARCVPAHIPSRPKGRTVVVGAGKAAAAMAQAFERHFDGPLEGLVITRDGYAVPTERIEVVQAAHPVPDARGRQAALRILDLARGLGEDDLLVCLLSGGGSALLVAPAEGLALEDKQAVTAALLRAGAPIQHLNTVRKHLSATKGGRLALAAAPARILTLAISDIVGDDPTIIASGPTVADPTTPADALALLQRYGVAMPDAVRRHLESAAADTPAEVPAGAYVIAARPLDALAAAAAQARLEGLEPILLGDAVEGEARDVACTHVDMARRRLGGNGPAVILSGGELTVSVRGQGQGGPNQEYALAMALALDGCAGISALAADTDGVDGVGEAAGAFVDPTTPVRARAAGVDLGAALADNDSNGAFARLGDLLVTPPTLTNVNDFRAIIVRPST
ncbi:MAG: glycerate kinase [Pseudomonadota bacterium]|nr:glycerate kinase [Pseudomonadota bacterium]